MVSFCASSGTTPRGTLSTREASSYPSRAVSSHLAGATGMHHTNCRISRSAFSSSGEWLARHSSAGDVARREEHVVHGRPAEAQRVGRGRFALHGVVLADRLVAVHQSPVLVGARAVLFVPHLAATRTGERSAPAGFDLVGSRLPADQVFPFGGHPVVAVRTRQDDPAASAVLVLGPRAALLGRDRALHVDPLPRAVGPGAGLELRDLVAFAAPHARLVHAVGLGDHHHPRGEPGPALVAAAAGHELERGAVEELDRLDASTPAAAAPRRQQVAVPREPRRAKREGIAGPRLVSNPFAISGINERGRELSLSALCVNPVVGGNSAEKISSPKGTLFVTILSFSLDVTHLPPELTEFDTHSVPLKTKGTSIELRTVRLTRTQ